MKEFYSNFLKNLGLFLTLAISAVSVYAAPPANDNFANAQAIGGNSGTLTAVNTSATKEASEKAHALNSGGASVWYKFVASGAGVLRIDTSNASFDTLLAVYSGTSLANLALIAGNDEGKNIPGPSRIYFGTQTGTTYYIAVDGKYDDATGLTANGSFTLNYSFENVMPNDNFANAAELRNDMPIYSTAFTNVGASKEVGEPNHSSNSGGRSVWFKWTSPNIPAKNYTFTLDPKNIANPNNFLIGLFSIYTGPSVDSLNLVGRYGGDRVGKIAISPQPNTTYYIAVDGYDFGNGAGAQLGNFMLSVGVTKSEKTPDFDRDGKADISVYRPTNGTFYALDSVTDAFRAVQWGLNGDKPMFSDADGDGKTDYLVYRPDTQIWYINRSFGGSFTSFSWGINTDVPLVLNQYDVVSGGFYDFAAVFRQTTGSWWIYRYGFAPITMQFGLSGDVPMTFDYTGDGTDEIAVFRPSTGTWYLANPFTGQFVGAHVFGQAGDIPVPADYDGDGSSDIAIFRPSTGTWWLLNKETGAQTALQFGAAGDKPQPADYDGDGRADLAVYRSGTWWILRSSTGAIKVAQFGLDNDTPTTFPLH